MLYYIFFFIILMNLILKQFCIIIGVFSITLWVQDMDDKKYNKKIPDVYDKYKFPLLISAIIGLLINIPEIIMKNNTNNKIPESFINSIRPNAQMSTPSRRGIEESPFTKQRLQNDIPDTFDGVVKPTDLGNGNNIKFDKLVGGRQIYTGLPDF